MLKVCLVIPVFRHAYMLKGFINKLNEYSLIIIDDGNSESDKAILSKLAEQNNVTLVSLLVNEGKGAAVIEGFKAAVKLGYTHAIQVDADGQHNTDDLKSFIKLAEENPHALINSWPEYDETVPKIRKVSREITNFWVRVETLSKDIKDAMCGLRVYPLAGTMPVINKGIISKRMGFDVEIIVKLHWNGVKIINKPVKVTYPKENVSNYKMVVDNIKLSALHTYLVAKMIFKKILRIGK